MYILHTFITDLFHYLFIYFQKYFKNAVAQNIFTIIFEYILHTFSPPFIYWLID